MGLGVLDALLTLSYPDELSRWRFVRSAASLLRLSSVDTERLAAVSLRSHFGIGTNFFLSIS